MMSKGRRSHRPLHQLLRWGRVLFCAMGIVVSGFAVLHPELPQAAGSPAQLSRAGGQELPSDHDRPGTHHRACSPAGTHCFPSAVLADADTSRGNARDAACNAEPRRLAGSCAAPLFHPPKLSA